MAAHALLLIGGYALVRQLGAGRTGAAVAGIAFAYAPWRLMISRYRNMLVQPQVLGYKRHPILHPHWQYLDVAPRGPNK